MNKAEIIKGINIVIEGLNTLCDAIDSEDKSEGKVAPAIPAKTPAKTPAKPAIGGKGKVAAKTSASSTSEKSGDTYTVAELEGMKYNEFKKLASSLGVDCKGTREEIMARVVETGVVSDADNSGDKSGTKTSAPAKAAGKSGKSASVGKSNAKKTSSPTKKDKFDEQAEAIIAENSAEDIIEELAGVGVNATKLNYKKQLVTALREGMLEVDYEGGEDTATNSEEDLVAEDYYKEYDLYEANDPDNMTEERSAACIEKQNSILEAVVNEELSGDDIAEYLQTVATQEELDLLGDEYTDIDLVKLYIEVSKHFIDDDGEEHEPGESYNVSEVPFCCGQPLAYDEATSKFLCSHCAAEYEAE